MVVMMLSVASHVSALSSVSTGPIAKVAGSVLRAKMLAKLDATKASTNPVVAHFRTATHSTQVTEQECRGMVGRTHFSRFNCTITGIRGWRKAWANQGWCDVDMGSCQY